MPQRSDRKPERPEPALSWGCQSTPPFFFVRFRGDTAGRNVFLVCEEAKTERIRIKGRKKIPRKQPKPLIIEDEDIEYTGIAFPENNDERPLCEMMEQAAEAECPAESEKPRPAIPAEGIVTDAVPPDAADRSRGLLYEIAEELYIREKTAAELEALARPPFQKVFDRSDTASLDREAARRTKRLIEKAGENAPSPTFLPEAVYEENARPLGTIQAFAAELLLMLPLIGIAAAIVFSLNPRINKNLRSLSRAYLILAAIVITAAAVFFAGRMAAFP